MLSSCFETITGNSLLANIRDYILNSPFYLEMSEVERTQSIQVFDPIQSYTLVEIFHGAYLLGGDEVEWISEDVFHLVNPTRTETPDYVPVGKQPILPEVQPGKVEYTRSEEAALAASSTSSILQTKSSTWTMPTPSVAKTQTSAAPDCEIQVLASLIQNPHNLGGLSRVSEIFGASSLAISNLQAVSTKEFTSVSVSSEHWLPITEVRGMTEIKDYIRKRKVEGYTIVGIEQTDSSHILGKDDSWKLPRKAVLLLGSEREGIPAELLGEVDLCVEIEQRGETRSLNVQTAAAVVCYEWNRHWRQ